MKTLNLEDEQYRLLGFLLDDVRKLVDCINSDLELAKVETPDAQFENLDDFACYWDMWLNKLNEAIYGCDDSYEIPDSVKHYLNTDLGIRGYNKTMAFLSRHNDVEQYIADVQSEIELLDGDELYSGKVSEMREVVGWLIKEING